MRAIVAGSVPANVAMSGTVSAWCVFVYADASRSTRTNVAISALCLVSVSVVVNHAAIRKLGAIASSGCASTSLFRRSAHSAVYRA